jgi:ferredoxin
MARDQLDELEVEVAKCLHCGACVGSCPENAIFLNEVLLQFGDDCTLCKRCIKVCPVGAISKCGGD